MKNPTYAGKIANTAAQFVAAPIKPVCKKGKTVKHTGKDLRTK